MTLDLAHTLAPPSTVGSPTGPLRAEESGNLGLGFDTCAASVRPYLTAGSHRALTVVQFAVPTATQVCKIGNAPLSLMPRNNAPTLTTVQQAQSIGAALTNLHLTSPPFTRALIWTHNGQPVAVLSAATTPATSRDLDLVARSLH